MSGYLPDDDPAIDLDAPAPAETAAEGSPSAARADPTPDEPSLGAALLGGAMGGCLMFCFAALLVPVVGLSNLGDGPGLIAISLASQPGLLAGVALALAAFRRPMWHSVAWRAVPWWVLLVAPLGLLGASVLGDWCGAQVWQALGKPDSALHLIAESMRAVPRAWQPLAILGLGLLPGLCEEVLFRGLLQGSLLRYGRLVALVVPSLAFALFHFDPVQGTGAFVLGLYLGELRHRTGSILPGVVGHTVNNLAAGLLVAVGPARQDDMMRAAPWGAVLLGALVAALCLAGVRRREP